MAIEPTSQRERYYLRKLLVGDRRTLLQGALHKVKQAVTRQSNNEFRGKKELAEYLTDDPQKSLSHAYRFINTLEDHGCLDVVDQDYTASKPVDIIRVDKAAVRDAVYASDMYHDELPLWRHLINKANDL